MCGIYGIVDPDRRVDARFLEKTVRTMRHRGPDTSGVWVSEDRKVGLAHCRLAIIDLDPRSNQPMTNRDETLVLSYNGETYNFQEIRGILEGKGHHFRTLSDTEVILHSYEEWGLECVHQFRGMFAFALFDKKRDRLWLVRDRLGIKPLIYYWDGSLFGFSSEIPSLAQPEKFDRALDTSALYDALTYLYIPAPKTAYRHVRKLEAGHWLVYENGEVSLKKYWDIDEIGSNEIDEETACGRVRETLSDAVRLRLISDVPLGVLLSGGMDSSTVAYFAQQNSTTPITTFSLGFDVKTSDELEYANLVANHVGSHHITSVYHLTEARRDAGSNVFLYGEPHGDSSILPSFAVCEMAKRSVTVALSGDGGDEVFCGYTRYNEFPRHNQQHSHWFHGAFRRILLENVPLLARGRNRLLRYHLDEFDLYTLLCGGLNKTEKRSLLDPDVFHGFRSYDDYWLYRKYWKPDLPIRTRLQYLDVKTYLADDILVKMDRASMALSLETRLPFLDHKLVEEVFSWPENIRDNGRTLKYILKKAVRGLLPQEILDKPKHGFSIPWRAWARHWGEMRTVFGDGTFFRKNLRLPKYYMLLVLQQWLKSNA